MDLVYLDPGNNTTDDDAIEALLDDDLLLLWGKAVLRNILITRMDLTFIPSGNYLYCEGSYKRLSGGPLDHCSFGHLSFVNFYSLILPFGPMSLH